MSIETGQYSIDNVKQSNVAWLPDPNDGTPVAATLDRNDTKERWNVDKLSNGNYTLKNVGTNTYAVVGNRAGEGQTVEGRSTSQQWTIQETREKGRFTISPTDSNLYWGLVDNQTGTPVALASVATDNRNWWVFKKL